MGYLPGDDDGEVAGRKEKGSLRPNANREAGDTMLRNNVADGVLDAARPTAGRPGELPKTEAL